MKTEEAKAKYARWHARQRELGACRCKECMAAYPEKPSKPADLVGMYFDSSKENREIVVEPDELPAHIEDPREFFAEPGKVIWPARPDAVDQVLRAVERATDEEIDAVIGPPAPGEIDQRPYRDEGYGLEQLGRDKQAAWDRAKVAEETLESLRAHGRQVLGRWGKRAMGGGTYERNPEALIIYEKKLEAREAEMRARQYRADEREIQAERSRLTYEQARARLEAEFGAEQVSKSIAALERILSLQGEFIKLGEQVDEVQQSTATIHSCVEDLDEETDDLVRMFKALEKKVRGEGD